MFLSVSLSILSFSFLCRICSSGEERKKVDWKTDTFLTFPLLVWVWRKSLSLSSQSLSLYHKQTRVSKKGVPSSYLDPFDIGLSIRDSRRSGWNCKWSFALTDSPGTGCRCCPWCSCESGRIGCEPAPRNPVSRTIRHPATRGEDPQWPCCDV